MLRGTTVVLATFLLVSHGKECKYPSLHKRKVAWMNSHLKWRIKVIAWMRSIEEQCSIGDLEESGTSLFPCPDNIKVICRNASALVKETDMSNCTLAYCADGRYLDDEVLEKIWQHDFAAHERITPAYEAASKNCIPRSCPDDADEDESVGSDVTTQSTLEQTSQDTYFSSGFTAFPTESAGSTSKAPANYTEPRINLTDITGNWTVIQRRVDGSVDFNRNWTQYVNGFGDPLGEFWLGLEKIYHLTKNGDKELKIDMYDRSGTYLVAQYSVFSIASSADNYRLNVSGYSGNATDAMAYPTFDSSVNDQEFSTPDADNDQNPTNCAYRYRSGWWFNSCHSSNLNGEYHGSSWRGIVWPNQELRQIVHMSQTEMKIRPK